MTKLDYIIRQISKTNKKNYENYVVTRIWHGLNNTDIKFTTQQYVKRKEGYALTDMFFPQLDLHVEVDEPHHLNFVDLDKNREIDIIEATNHIVERIEITNDIKYIDSQCDNLVKLIQNLIIEKTKNNKFESWDLEKEFNPDYYKTKGYLDVSENPAFRRTVDACNCLGQNYIGVQRAYFKSKKYENHYLWFPKFYENESWDNKITDNGETIIEKCKIDGRKEKHYHDLINSKVKRIVFPRSIDNLGFALYRFKGLFEVDKEKSSIENGMVYKRISTKLEI